MNKDLFFTDMDRMATAYHASVPAERSRIYWERLSVYSDQDWSEAVEYTLDHDDRFPSISRLKLTCQNIAMNRREGDQKEREKIASERNPEKITSFGEILESIPFPPELKQALHDKIQGKINQEQLEAITKTWSKQNSINRPCSCDDDGLIYYTKNNYQYVGKCSKHASRSPKIYPTVDPITMTVQYA